MNVCLFLKVSYWPINIDPVTTERGEKSSFPKMIILWLMKHWKWCKHFYKSITDTPVNQLENVPYLSIHETRNWCKLFHRSESIIHLWIRERRKFLCKINDIMIYEIRKMVQMLSQICINKPVPFAKKILIHHLNSGSRTSLFPIYQNQ